MDQKTIKDIPQKDLANKKVLVRVDFNVPLEKSGNTVTVSNDLRIKAALPTIKYLIESKALVTLVSHLGRPKGVEDTLRMDPVAKKLSELLGKNIIKLNDCIGPEVESKIASLSGGDVCLLENVRFYKEETKNDTEFARKLAKPHNIFVNDAFGTSHRAHASTAGVTAYLSPSLAGFLLEKEVDSLNKILQNPIRPFTTILGGSKVSSKIEVIKQIIPKVDTLLIGGAMAFTFVKFKGGEIGNSIFEAELLPVISEINKLKEDYAVALILPTDMLCAKSECFETRFKKEDLKIFPIDKIPNGYTGLDIGPESIKSFQKLISQSKTLFWNGPMGMFENPLFLEGTKGVANALVESTKNKCITVVGGGDSVSAIEDLKIPFSSFTHVSTGGGASIEFVEGKILPGISCLDKKDSYSTAKK